MAAMGRQSLSKTRDIHVLQFEHINPYGNFRLAIDEGLNADPASPYWSSGYNLAYVRKWAGRTGVR